MSSPDGDIIDEAPRLSLAFPMTVASRQAHHLQLAHNSIQQALNWFASKKRHWNYPPNTELQNAVRGDIQTLKAALEKIEQPVIRIATFGLVSRGKSAVINALIGQKMLPTGPLHGVTQWPQSIRWTSGDKVQIELIDTPGLDEIAGEARTQMAQDVAQQADLILFIITGDITHTEFDALCDLKKSCKPLLLVFNKIDLYPDQDRETIFQQLQNLGKNYQQLPIFSSEEIIGVAAEPASIPVRLEYSDRPTEETWETPPPQIDNLRQKILDILNQEGRSLLALNALLQTQKAEESIAQKTLNLRQAEADQIIWKYAQYKALVVAINPIGLLDILGGLIADLFLIRALARLYGLPITSFEAGKLWQQILIGTGGLFVSELGSSLLLGFSKTSHFWESAGSFTSYASAAFFQAGIAGYSAYRVGQAAKYYLANGCSWGPLGASTAIAVDQTEWKPPRNLSSKPGECGQMDWSPDGKQIALLLKTERGSTLYAIAVDETKWMSLIAEMARDEIQGLTWSPNSQQLAFTVMFNYDYSNLYVVNRDGSGLKPLTFGKNNVSNPAWRP